MKTRLNDALKHILQAQELVQSVIDDNNYSLIRKFGHDLNLISNGLMRYGDNRDNFATTLQGLDTIIEEEGISWREEGEDEDEKIKWVNKIDEIMPDVYKRKYSTNYKPDRFYYMPLLTEEEEKEFRDNNKIIEY